MTSCGKRTYFLKEFKKDKITASKLQQANTIKNKHGIAITENFCYMLAYFMF